MGCRYPSSKEAASWGRGRKQLRCHDLAPSVPGTTEFVKTNRPTIIVGVVRSWLSRRPTFLGSNGPWQRQVDSLSQTGQDAGEKLRGAVHIQACLSVYHPSSLPYPTHTHGLCDFGQWRDFIYPIKRASTVNHVIPSTVICLGGQIPHQLLTALSLLYTCSGKPLQRASPQTQVQRAEKIWFQQHSLLPRLFPP